ncbi:hypothetical protein MXEN_11500 [Mycobacterium xenopi RIVM700367]|nr:hypothetical protein MXEN_11500 [Mycobacterium xenopi RIVM700367]
MSGKGWPDAVFQRWMRTRVDWGWSNHRGFTAARSLLAASVGSAGLYRRSHLEVNGLITATSATKMMGGAPVLGT